MSDGSSVSIPTWALPLVFAVGSGLMVYGASEARAEATAEEVAEIKIKVEQADTAGKLNAQAIDQISRNLAEMSQTARDSDAKLQTLIELMIKNAQ